MVHNMVDRRPEGNRGIVRITRNHTESHSDIRELIKGALAPLVVDPVPTEVLLEDIVVTKEPGGELNITCKVYYQYREGGSNLAGGVVE